MSFLREEMDRRGIVPADALRTMQPGRTVTVAGLVLVRQRPGTASGVIFATLEDETGVSNIIVRPDLYDRERTAVVRHPFLMVDGILQHQDGVVSVKAEHVEGIEGAASVDAHNFY